MSPNLTLYAALVAIPLAAYFGYDYGKASQIRLQERAAEALTKESVKMADEAENVRIEIKEKTREIVKVVEVAVDSSGCLDAQPPQSIRDGVRRQQGLDRSSAPAKVRTATPPIESGDDDKS